MSKAEDLLNSVDNEPSLYLVNPDTEPHIVIDENRKVTVPDELKRIAVQFDHRIETVTFDCPRYWDGHDMSVMAVYINYACPDKTLGSYPADNVRIDEEDPNIMHFEWVITGNVTQAKGNISFLVCAKNVDEEGNENNHWNSELNDDMYISEGLECTETFENQHPDLYTQLILLSDRTAVDAEEVRSLAEDVKIADADIEKHMKIAVTAAGSAAQSVLEVERLIEEGGIPGPKGDQGEPGIQGESGVTVTANSLFTLAVDPETGDLYAYCSDEADTPEFEYDEETGNLYLVMEVED